MASVRRVRRVIRKIDPWTVLKVSIIFNAVVALAVVLGIVILWSLLSNVGLPDRIVEIAGKLSFDITIDGEAYFRVVLFLAVVWTVLATGLATLAAVLYNLISDVVGGIEVVVLEETLATPAAPPAPIRAVHPSPSRRSEEAARLADLPTQETTVGG